MNIVVFALLCLFMSFGSLPVKAVNIEENNNNVQNLLIFSVEEGFSKIVSAISNYSTNDFITYEKKRKKMKGRYRSSEDASQKEFCKMNKGKKQKFLFDCAYSYLLKPYYINPSFTNFAVYLVTGRQLKNTIITPLLSALIKVCEKYPSHPIGYALVREKNNDHFIAHFFPDLSKAYDYCSCSLCAREDRIGNRGYLAGLKSSTLSQATYMAAFFGLCTQGGASQYSRNEKNTSYACDEKPSEENPQFSCGGGSDKTIPITSVCDGIKDCDKGQDETYEYTRGYFCKEPSIDILANTHTRYKYYNESVKLNRFQCYQCGSSESPSIIPISAMCDGQADCSNGDDENYPPNSSNCFSCDNGRLKLPQHKICNFYMECLDGSDEDPNTPEVQEKIKNGYCMDCKSTDSYTLVSGDVICDNHEDCVNGRDEDIENIGVQAKIKRGECKICNGTAMPYYMTCNESENNDSDNAAKLTAGIIVGVLIVGGSTVGYIFRLYKNWDEDSWKKGNRINTLLMPFKEFFSLFKCKNQRGHNRYGESEAGSMGNGEETTQLNEKDIK